MTNINPNPFTTRPGNRRHLRRRHLDALDRDRGRHGDAGEGRQRLRRRGRHRVHAAGGRAASQRPGRRRAGHRLRRAARQAGSDLRPGPGAGRRHHRALSRAKASTSCPAPGCLPPACPARSRPGCCCCATTARCRLPTCSRPRSAMRRTAIRWSSAPTPPSPRSRELFREHWPTSAAVYLPNDEVPPTGTLFTNKTLAATYARILKEAESAGGDRDRADRARAQSLVAGLRRRGDRPVLPHAGGHGHQRHAASRRAHRRRHGALARRASKRR